MGATIGICHGNYHLPKSRTHQGPINIIDFEHRRDKETMRKFGCTSYEHPLIPDRCWDCGEEIVAIIKKGKRVE